MKSLSADGTLQPLHPDACKCGLKCHLGVQVADVIAHRVEILNVVPATEVGCSTYLATSIRMSLANTQGSTPYTWQGKKVCREFFATVSGVSVNKIKRVRKAANSPAGLAAEALARAPSCRAKGPKYYHAYTFWYLFLERHCQRPNEDIRLFPVDKSYECIWNEYFLPWFAGQNLPACDMPTLVYWKKVRWSEEFADVKRRAKHYHCRCSKCAKLQAKLLASFANRADHLAYQRERRLHDDSVTAWRKLEAHVITLAQSTPDDQILP